MSEQTKRALERAILEHVADECDGEIVTDWVLCTANTTPQARAGSTPIYYDVSDSPTHHSRGLLELALDWNKREAYGGQ